MMTYTIVPGDVNRGPLRNTADAGCGRADRGAEGWNWNPAKANKLCKARVGLSRCLGLFKTQV